MLLAKNPNDLQQITVQYKKKYESELKCIKDQGNLCLTWNIRKLYNNNKTNLKNRPSRLICIFY